MYLKCGFNINYCQTPAWHIDRNYYPRTFLWLSLQAIGYMNANVETNINVG